MGDITREKFKEFADSMVPLFYFSEQHYGLANFTIPVGPRTRVSVKFDGPVGVEEYESLLAHVAYYKTFSRKTLSLFPQTLRHTWMRS